jgi:hypothetical protein
MLNMKIFFWDEEKTMRSFFLTLSWAKKKILWVYLCEKKKIFFYGGECNFHRYFSMFFVH